MLHILYGGLAIAAGIGMFFLQVENSWIAAIGFIVIGALILGYGIRLRAAGKKQRKIERQLKKRLQQEKKRKAVEDLLR